jgi:hypothetical protein
MSLYLDEQYAGHIGLNVRNFKQKRNNIWRFSCPICGDSTNLYKAHGYLYPHNQRLYFKCFLCDVNMSLGDLIKSLDGKLHKEYLYELFLERDGPRTETRAEQFAKDRELFRKRRVVTKPVETEGSEILLAGCTTIGSLPGDHPARIYIEGRKIPAKFFDELYWTDNFPVVARAVCPTANLMKNEGRIIIPFLDETKRLVAIQGRSLTGADGFKYITIKAYDDAPRIFGMHRLSKDRERLYAVEGPFDSLFLDECVALAGGDIPHGFPKEKTVIVYDNEPRKHETCERISKAISHGYTVCIWPATVSHKDINLMVLNGYSLEKVKRIIDENSFYKLSAQMQLSLWRKDVR